MSYLEQTLTAKIEELAEVLASNQKDIKAMEAANLDAKEQMATFQSFIDALKKDKEMEAMEATKKEKSDSEAYGRLYVSTRTDSDLIDCAKATGIRMPPELEQAQAEEATEENTAPEEPTD
jgi:uncharacterized protein (DUF4415 family)